RARQPCPTRRSSDLRAFRNADLIIGTSLQCSACERDPAPFLQGVLEHGLWGAPLPPGPWSRRAFEMQLEQAAPLPGRARVDAYRSEEHTSELQSLRH